MNAASPGDPRPDDGARADPRAPTRLRRLVARMSASRLVRRAASGAFWSVLGQVVSRALNVVGSILVARQLGATGFGEYSLVLVTVGMFQNVAGLGLVTTSTKFLAGTYRSDPAAAGRVVALSNGLAAVTGWVSMIGVFVAAPSIARDVLDAPQIATALRVGAVLLLFGPLYGAQLGTLSGLERFRQIAFASTIAAIAAIPLVVVGAALGGATGSVMGLVVSIALSNGLHGFAARRALRGAGIVPRYRGALSEWRMLFSYGLPATLANVLLGAVSWGSSAILAHVPAGLREVGIFGAANQWRNAIVLVTTAAGAALLPLFSDLHDNGRPRTLQRAFWNSFGASALASAATAGAIWLAAPTIMRTYGAEFADATGVLVLLAATGALAGPLTIAGHAIAGAGRMWLSLGLKVIWGGTLLGLAWALRARGAAGLASANVIAFAVHLVVSIAAVAMLLHCRPTPASVADPSGG